MTAVRRQKDIANTAKAAGDDVLRREAQYNIERYQAAYDRITNKALLTADKSSMRVSGFSDVKTFDELSDAKKYENAVFSSDKLRTKHVKKHLAEYGDISEEEYIDRARKLLQSDASDDILVLQRQDGGVAKYRVSTNEFVVGTREGKIRTAFKPKRGRKYWDNVVKKERDDKKREQEN